MNYTKKLNENDFKQLLKTYRTVNNMTQADLAYKSGVNQQYIHFYESTKRKVTVNDFIKLMEGMDYDVQIKIRKDDKEWIVTM